MMTEMTRATLGISSIVNTTMFYNVSKIWNITNYLTNVTLDIVKKYKE